jgi:putative addiction module component (TIGR02574 family)
MSDYDETLHAAQSLTPDERLKLIARLWASLPHELWPTPTEKQLDESHRRLAGEGIRSGEAVPWLVVEQMLADCVRSTRPVIYSAPRRFDLATIFVVTSAFAVLYGAMASFNMPPALSIMVGIFVAAVGVGQAALFGGLKPRTASIVVGAVMYPILWVASVMIFSPGVPAPVYVMTILGGAISGGIFGYIAGVMVGGVFLIADKFRQRFARPSRPDEAVAAPEENPFTTG